MSVHPSRMGLVPNGADRSTEGQERERELREKLRQSREQRPAYGDGEGASSSAYNRPPPPERWDRRPPPPQEGHNGGGGYGGPPPGEYGRHPHGGYGGGYGGPPHGGPPHGGYGYGHPPDGYRPPPPPRDGDGVPPPGAWGRRPPTNGGPLPPQHGGPPGGYNNSASGPGDFMSARNEERKRSTLSIWPPSPRSPYQSEDEDEKRRREKKKRHKSSRHHGSSKHSSSRHRSSRHHRDEGSSSRRHRRHRSRSYDSRDESEDEEERRRRRRKREKERDRGGGSRRHRSRSYDEGEDERDGEDRKSSRRHRRRSSSSPSRSRSRSRSEPHQKLSAHTVALPKSGKEDDANDSRSSSPDIGPQLPDSVKGNQVDSRAYGRALLPGEGAAMAAFVQEGARIPRRGEIGLSSDQIEDYERAGFVMSGSRHRRMNAVRVRKENQVLGAEEQRALLNERREEQGRKEREILGQFREMLDEYGAGSGSGR